MESKQPVHVLRFEKYRIIQLTEEDRPNSQTPNESAECVPLGAASWCGGGGRRKFNIQFSPAKEIGNISFVFFYLPLLFSLTACQKNLKWI